MAGDDPMNGQQWVEGEGNAYWVAPGKLSGKVTRIKRQDGYGFIRPDEASLRSIKDEVSKGFKIVEQSREKKSLLKFGALSDDLFDVEPDVNDVIFSGDVYYREDEFVDAEPMIGDEVKFDWEISETKKGKRIRCINISGGTRPEFSNVDGDCHVGEICMIKKFGDGYLRTESGGNLIFDDNDKNEFSLKLFVGKKVIYQHHEATKRATNIRAVLSSGDEGIGEDRIRIIEEEQKELRKMIEQNATVAKNAQNTANDAHTVAKGAQQKVGDLENSITNLPTKDDMRVMLQEFFAARGGGGGNPNHNGGNQNFNQNFNPNSNAGSAGGGGAGLGEPYGGGPGGGGGASGSNPNFGKGDPNFGKGDPNLVDPKGKGKLVKGGKKGSGPHSGSVGGKGSPADKGGGGPGKVRDFAKTLKLNGSAELPEVKPGGEETTQKRKAGRPRKNSAAAKKNPAGNSRRTGSVSKKVVVQVKKNAADDKSVRRGSFEIGRRSSVTSNINVNLPGAAKLISSQTLVSLTNIMLFCIVFLTDSLCSATSPRVQIRPRLLDSDSPMGLLSDLFESELGSEEGSVAVADFGEEIESPTINYESVANFGAGEEGGSDNNHNDNNATASDEFSGFEPKLARKLPRKKEVTVRGTLGNPPAVDGVNITIAMQNLGGVDEMSQKYVKTCNEAADAGYQVLVTPELDWRNKAGRKSQLVNHDEFEGDFDGVEREAGKVVVIPKLFRPVALVKGVAITILDDALAEEFLLRWSRGEVVAEGGDRYVTIHLKNLVVTGFYAPQQRAGRKEWESVFFEAMDRLVKRKEGKWKRKIWLGDANTQVAAGKGRCVGPHGPDVAGAGGARWGRVLEELNTVLINSWIDLGGENRYTFRGFRPEDESDEVERYGKTEIDQILVPGRWKNSIQEFERRDLGEGYDHMFIGCVMNCQSFVDVLHENQRRGRGAGLKWIGKEDHHKAEVINATGRLNSSMHELDGKEDVINDLQTVMEMHRSDFLKADNVRDKMKKMSGEFFVGGSEDVTKMWDWYRSSSKKKRICGITKTEAAEQCKRVSCDPMWKDLENLPMGDDFFEGMPKMNEEELRMMEEEISPEGFRSIVTGLRRGAAMDGRGLAVELLDFLDIDSDKIICNIFNEVLEKKQGIANWDWRSKTSKNSPLYKQGPIRVSSNYRYLSIGPLLMKVLVTIMTKRKRAILQCMKYYSMLTLGFLPSVGVIESLLLYSLMDESCMKFIEAEGFLDVIMELLDIRKAFPSSDTRYIDKSYEALGLGDSKWYSLMRSARVDSKYSFTNFRESQVEPDDTFQVDHGYKEGCTGSPDGYVMGYEPVMNRTERLREKVGSLGIKLVSLTHVVRDPMVRMAKAIYGKVSEVGEKVVNRISRTNFADDTTQYEQVLRNKVSGEIEKYLGQCGGLEETWKKAGINETVIESGKDEMREKEKGVDIESGGPALHIFRGVLAEIGSRENFSKYVQGVMGMARNGLRGRNLGQQMNHSDDCDVRSARAWAGYYAFKSKVCGIGIGIYQIGKLVIAVARSALQFGRTSRATSKEENDRCQKDENAMVRRLLGINPFIMNSPNFDINMHDLRFRMRISDYTTSLFYHKARQWAHWLRSEKIGNPLLTGVLLPEKSSKVTGEKEVSDTEYIVWAGKKLNQVRGRPDLIEEAYRHLCDKCMFPEYAVSAISMCNTEVGKRAYYVLTREEFVRSMLNDYRLGKQITEEKLEKRKKELCKRHQLRNPLLNSYKMYFERGYCCICQEHGFGSEVRRERHFHLYHDIGLRGDEYEEQMQCWSVEEKLWEKKLGEAVEMRRKMALMDEPAFLERNAGKIELIKNRGVKNLGTYKCIACQVNYTSSTDALERHLEVHESKEVTKYYKLRGAENRFHCAEQNFTGGKCFPGQNTALFGFIINGVKYNEGDTWKCGRCAKEIEWKVGYNGKKIRRIVEKVEEHLVHLRISGFCAGEKQNAVEN